MMHNNHSTGTPAFSVQPTVCRDTWSTPFYYMGGVQVDQGHHDTVNTPSHQVRSMLRPMMVEDIVGCIFVGGEMVELSP